MFIVFEEVETRQPKAGEWYSFKDIGEESVNAPHFSAEDWAGDDPEMPILKRHEFDSDIALINWFSSRDPEEWLNLCRQTVAFVDGDNPTTETTLESTEPSRRERIFLRVFETIMGSEGERNTIVEAVKREVGNDALAYRLTRAFMGDAHKNAPFAHYVMERAENWTNIIIAQLDKGDADATPAK